MNGDLRRAYILIKNSIAGKTSSKQ